MLALRRDERVETFATCDRSTVEITVINFRHGIKVMLARKSGESENETRDRALTMLRERCDGADPAG